MTKLVDVKIFNIFYTIFCILLIEVLCLRNYSVSNCNCGRANFPSGRIIGGENAAKDEFPWQVGLYGRDFYFCGASLINNMYVMTAVLCFIDRYYYENGVVAIDLILKDVSVVLGAYERKRLNEYNASEEGIDIQKIVEFIPHVKYNYETNFNDICLLKLKNPLKVYTSSILPICLFSTTESFVGKNATIAGWGVEFEDGKKVTILKKREDINIIDNWRCYDWTPPYFWIGKSRMCSEPLKSGPCFGDSGGPLMIKNDMNKYDQIGIISTGFGCGSGGVKLYTRLSSFKIWIEEKTADATYCEH